MPVKRIKDISISRPIIYGNNAVPMQPADRKKNTPEDHTHKWTIFVRDPSGKDDLCYFIKKVTFTLHDTYEQPLRVVEKPPYEVTETGWGEFEVIIRIYFCSAINEKNVVLYHHLKLHPYGKNAGSLPARPKPVESIFYDEIVFTEPTEQIFELLTSRPGAILPTKSHPPFRPFSLQAENDELDRLSAAIDKVAAEAQVMKRRIHKLEAEHSELTKSQKQQKA